MSLKSELLKEGIEVISKLPQNKVNIIAKRVSYRLTKAFPEQNINFYELFSKLSNLNMFIAKIPNGIAAKYFYKNNSIYFSDTANLTNLNDVALHECIHSLQTERNASNKLVRLGLYNFSDHRNSGLGINEAAVQYMTMKCLGTKLETVKYFGIEIPTYSPDYYALECNLIMQMAYITGQYSLFNSTLYGNNNFEDKFIALTNKKTYNRIKNNINYIIYLEDSLGLIYQKLQLAIPSSVNYFKLLQKSEDIKESIKNLFINTQTRIFTSYFDNYFNSLYTKKSFENFRASLYNYKNLIGITDDYNYFNEYYISKMTELERKYYSTGDMLSLLVPIKQTKLSILIRKIRAVFSLKSYAGSYNQIKY